jgi:hypothetical protein
MGRGMTMIAISKPALLSLLGSPQEYELRAEFGRMTWRCGCCAGHKDDLSYLWQPCRDHRKGTSGMDFSDALSA